MPQGATASYTTQADLSTFFWCVCGGSCLSVLSYVAQATLEFFIFLSLSPKRWKTSITAYTWLFGCFGLFPFEAGSYCIYRLGQPQVSTFLPWLSPCWVFRCGPQQYTSSHFWSTDKPNRMQILGGSGHAVLLSDNSVWGGYMYHAILMADNGGWRTSVHVQRSCQHVHADCLNPVQLTPQLADQMQNLQFQRIHYIY